MIKTKHNHTEAFALMWYVCECGHAERIWNSRDGVTPFGFGCPSCGQIAHHVAWHSDLYSPKYKLRHGQRFWRGGTPDEAEAIMRRRIKQIPCSPEKEAELIAWARKGEGEFQTGWPMLDQCKDY